jgi:large subunit ribosomal protein L10
MVMPLMAKKTAIEAKKVVVAEVASFAEKAISAVLVDYSSLTANQMTQLRNAARNANVYLRVVKNTLSRLAFKDTELACLHDSLVGPLFIALSFNAPSDAARLLKDYAKKFDKLKVTALSVSGQRYSAEQLDLIASLPTRDEALGKLLYVMKAPIEKMVRTIAEPHTKLVRALAEIKNQKAA